MKLLNKVIVLFGAIIILHLSATKFGIYDMQIEKGFVWFDNILHILAGIAFGLTWVWIAQKRNYRHISIMILTFVAVTAVIWEVFEFGMLKLLIT